MHHTEPAPLLILHAPPPALAPAARRWAALAALAAHAGLAAWLLQAPAAVPPRAVVPVLAVDLVAPEVPPPAPVPAPAAVPVALREAAPAPRRIVAAPSPAPAVVPAEPVAAAPVSAAAASAPGAEAAVVVTVAAAPAPAPAPAPARDLPPSAIAYRDPPAPVYPRASRRAGEAGLVVVRVFVDESGHPRAVQLAQSSGHARLDAAATEAVLQARFHPPTDQGRPTAGWARIPIPFELEPLP